jgi:hypothetical protein
MLKKKSGFVLFLASILWILAGSASAQYAYRIVPVTALPATCNPLNGSVVTLITGPATIYHCSALNNWAPVGSTIGSLIVNQGTLIASNPFLQHTATWNNGAVTFTNFISNVTDTASAVGSQLFSWGVGGNEVFGGTKLGRLYVTQPTLTASLPFMNHTATWNNGAVTFVDDFRNITDTASAATSLLSEWQVGGADIFRVRKDGTITVADGGQWKNLTRSGMQSTADGLIRFANNAGTDFGRLSLGPEAVTNPAIIVSAAAGGQTQGIIIGKGDGTFATFANLGAATNGSMIYCSDCQAIAVCAAAGTGAIAKRLAGAWVCN